MSCLRLPYFTFTSIKTLILHTFLFGILQNLSNSSSQDCNALLSSRSVSNSQVECVEWEEMREDGEAILSLALFSELNARAKVREKRRPESKWEGRRRGLFSIPWPLCCVFLIRLSFFPSVAHFPLFLACVHFFSKMKHFCDEEVARIPYWVIDIRESFFNPRISFVFCAKVADFNLSLHE